MCSFGSGYRPFTSYWWRHWFRLSTWTHPFVFAYQRTSRGWADCDIWSLDWHLCRILPSAIRHLKKTKHGVPSELCQEYNDDVEKASKAFDEILEKIALGFEAGLQVMNAEANDENFVVFGEGMKLFHKWFFSLWD